MLAERLAKGRRFFQAARSCFGRREWLLCLSVMALAAAIATIDRSQHAAHSPSGFMPITQIAGKNWRYELNFPVYNPSTIQKLIDCESQGLNIGRPDSNGQMSWGILQFNGTSTWQEMERRFHFYGDPRNPPEAIHMADMMISSGLIGRWTCARSLGLAK
jgi:hypothetical protein